MKSEYKNGFFEDQFNKNEFPKIAVESDLSETAEKDEGRCSKSRIPDPDHFRVLSFLCENRARISQC